MPNVDGVDAPKKSKVPWKRLFALVFIVLFTAGTVGGSVFYVMGEFIKVRNDEISSLKGRIDNLERRLGVEDEVVTDEDEDEDKEEVPESTSEVETIKAGLCSVDEETILSELTYVENDNGKFVGCGIGNADGFGGFMLIGKKIDEEWTKVWAGNGSMEDSEILKYKIPSSIYYHNLNVN